MHLTVLHYFQQPQQKFCKTTKLCESAQCQACQSVHNQDKLMHKMAHVNNLRDQAACATPLPASQVGPACCQTRAQDSVSGCICRCRPQPIGKLIHTLNLCLENDCHNDPVNGHCFAKNDTASITHKSLMNLHDALHAVYRAGQCCLPDEIL